jgi:hypothetical protein
MHVLIIQFNIYKNLRVQTSSFISHNWWFREQTSLTMSHDPYII